MSLQTWQEALISAQQAGTLYNTYTTAKTVLPVQSLVTFPANYFYIGRALRITIIGALSNVATSAGTITLQHMMGAVVAFTTGALTFSTTAHTTLPFWMETLLTCRAIGSSTSANFMGQSWIASQCLNISGADTTTSHTILLGPNTAPAVGTGWDSTAAQTLDFWAGFSNSQSGNGIQIQQYIVEALN